MKPCPTCTSRTWREIAGFLVLHCAAKNLRLGIQPDIQRGHVNKAGGCVAMPKQCAEFDCEQAMETHHKSVKPVRSFPLCKRGEGGLTPAARDISWLQED